MRKLISVVKLDLSRIKNKQTKLIYLYLWVCAYVCVRVLPSLNVMHLKFVQQKAEYLYRSILLKFCRCSVGFKSQRCDQKVNPCDYYCQNEGICTLTAFNEPRCK